MSLTKESSIERVKNSRGTPPVENHWSRRNLSIPKCTLMGHFSSQRGSLGRCSNFVLREQRWEGENTILKHKKCRVEDMELATSCRPLASHRSPWIWGTDSASFTLRDPLAIWISIVLASEPGRGMRKALCWCPWCGGCFTHLQSVTLMRAITVHICGCLVTCMQLQEAPR